MAQIETNAIVPITRLDEYSLTIKELDQLGRSTEFTIPAPSSPDFATWTLMQRVAMLKKGQCSRYPIADVLYLVARCHQHQLSAEDGDMFFTGEGRVGFSNKAKIKMALRSGNIKGIEATVKPIEGNKPPIGCTGATTDLECTVKVHVKGWIVPIVNTQRLSVWFKAKNPNWVGNPEHMLKLNTIAHACELVMPTETDEYERPTEDAMIAEYDKSNKGDITI